MVVTLGGIQKMSTLRERERDSPKVHKNVLGKGSVKAFV